MKILELRLNDQDPTDDAQQICDVFELSSGLRFCNRSATEPNDVHGFINTNSEGDVHVYLYETEDIEKLNSFSTANLAENPLSDEQIMGLVEAAQSQHPSLEVIGKIKKVVLTN